MLNEPLTSYKLGTFSYKSPGLDHLEEGYRYH